MIEELNKLSTAGAVVLGIGLIASAVVAVALILAFNGNKFPWEK